MSVGNVAVSMCDQIPLKKMAKILKRPPSGSKSVCVESEGGIFFSNQPANSEPFNHYISLNLLRLEYYKRTNLSNKGVKPDE